MITAYSKPVQQEFVSQFTPMGSEYVQALGTIKQDTERAMETSDVLRSFANNLQGVEGSNDSGVADEIKNEVLGQVEKLTANNPYLNNTLPALKSLAIKYKDDKRIAGLAGNREAFQRHLAQINEAKNMSSEDRELAKQMALNSYNQQLAGRKAGEVPTFTPMGVQDIANYGAITEQNAQQLNLFQQFPDSNVEIGKDGLPYQVDRFYSYNPYIPNFKERATESLTQSNLNDSSFIASAGYQADLRGFTGDKKDSFIKDVARKNAASVVEARTKMTGQKVKRLASGVQDKETLKKNDDLVALGDAINKSSTSIMSTASEILSFEDLITLNNKVIAPKIEKLSAIQKSIENKGYRIAQGRIAAKDGRFLTDAEVANEPTLARDNIDYFALRSEIDEFNGFLGSLEQKRKGAVTSVLGVTPLSINKEERTITLSQDEYKKLNPEYKVAFKVINNAQGTITLKPNAGTTGTVPSTSLIVSMFSNMSSSEEADIKSYLSTKDIVDKNEKITTFTPSLLKKMSANDDGYSADFIAKKDALEMQLSAALKGGNGYANSYSLGEGTTFTLVNEVGVPLENVQVLSDIKIIGISKGTNQKVQVQMKKGDKTVTGFLKTDGVSEDFNELFTMLDLAEIGVSKRDFPEKSKETTRIAVKKRISDTLEDKIRILTDSPTTASIVLDPLINAMQSTNSFYNFRLEKQPDGRFSLTKDGKNYPVFISNEDKAVFTKDDIMLAGGLYNLIAATTDKRSQQVKK